jgi:cytochrome c oxidase subunit III
MSHEFPILTQEEHDVLEQSVVIRHPLEEQFEDLEHQTHTASLSMWVFLVTEVMLFGGLFVGLAVYRYMYTEETSVASHKLNWIIGSLNGCVLIVSSMFMGLALHFAKHGRKRVLLFCLLATATFGILFLCLKGLEYDTDYRDNLIPGWKFDDSEWVTKEHLRPDQVPHVKLWLVFYWIMTGLHATHLTIGILLVIGLSVLASKGVFSPVYYSPVEVIGLYWHLVDIVWIFLLPMLYLQGTHTMADFHF